jgi:hypothetical protein
MVSYGNVSLMKTLLIIARVGDSGSYSIGGYLC